MRKPSLLTVAGVASLGAAIAASLSLGNPTLEHAVEHHAQTWAVELVEHGDGAIRIETESLTLAECKALAADIIEHDTSFRFESVTCADHGALTE